ncbi:cadherin repeat domain-containing protein [Nanoarchaeota archaeon]
MRKLIPITIAALGILYVGCGDDDNPNNDNPVAPISASSVTPSGSTVTGPFMAGFEMPSTGDYQGQASGTATHDNGTPDDESDDVTTELFDRTTSEGERAEEEYDPEAEGAPPGANITLEFTVEAMGADSPNTQTYTKTVTYDSGEDPMAPFFDWCMVNSASVDGLLGIQCRANSPAGQSLTYSLNKIDKHNTFDRMSGVEIDNEGTIYTERFLDQDDVALYELEVEVEDESGRIATYSNMFRVNGNQVTWIVNQGALGAVMDEDIADQINLTCGDNYDLFHEIPYDFEINRLSDGDPAMQCILDQLNGLPAQDALMITMYLPEGQNPVEFLAGQSLDALLSQYR